jgi:hypothetical protein
MNSEYDLEELANLSKEELQKALSRALEELGFGKGSVYRGKFGRKPKHGDAQPGEKTQADQENGNEKEQEEKDR